MHLLIPRLPALILMDMQRLLQNMKKVSGISTEFMNSLETTPANLVRENSLLTALSNVLWEPSFSGSDG